MVKKLIWVVVALAVLIPLWTLDISKTGMVIITVVWVVGWYGTVIIMGIRRERAGIVEPPGDYVDFGH